MQLAFTLGSYESTSNRGSDVHPSRQARRIAFRLGMAVGGFDYINREINRLSHGPSGPEVSQLIQKYRGMKNSIAYKTQFDPKQMDLLDWSYWQASRITHYNTIASRDIQVTVLSQNWSRNPAHPFVKYSISFQNTGMRSIRIDFAIQCDWFPKEDRRNTKESLLIDTNSYRFTLSPGEKRTIWDSLYTTISDPKVNASKYITVLTLPPMPTSLMRFEYTDGQDTDEITPILSTSFAVKSTEPLRQDLMRILAMYAGAAKSKFNDLVAGPSIRYMYEVDTDQVVQYGFTPFENLIETKIISSTSKRYPPYVAVTLFETLSETEQRRVFQDLSQKVASMDGLSQVTMTGTDPRQVSVYNYDGAQDHFVALARVKPANSLYQVMLVIKPKP